MADEKPKVRRFSFEIPVVTWMREHPEEYAECQGIYIEMANGEMKYFPKIKKPNNKNN